MELIQKQIRPSLLYESWSHMGVVRGQKTVSESGGHPDKGVLPFATDHLD
jgi:hypothetical protein